MLNSFPPLDDNDEPTQRDDSLGACDSDTVIAPASEVAALRAAIRAADPDAPAPQPPAWGDIEEDDVVDMEARALVLTRRIGREDALSEAPRATAGLMPSRLGATLPSSGEDRARCLSSTGPTSVSTDQLPAFEGSRSNDETDRIRAVSSPRTTDVKVAAIAKGALAILIAVVLGGSVGVYFAPHFP